MIRVADDGALRLITLDRPDKANALTSGMLEALCEAVEGAAEARALVLTGAGKVFSAGADLEAARAGLATSPLWERLSGAVAGFEGLSIAALNGTVAGGAMGMVLACDLRIAPASAKMFYPVMKLGFLPQPSDPARLAALAGPARAKMILMGGVKVGAEEAMRSGLIDRLAEGDVLAEARALAADTLAATPEHARAIKALIPALPGAVR
ncbi:enoyl-CoA hydratase/isomerase family protein [Aestuariicoccus sp. MJ-SS9]|uniref:enoyl-CoA hydratase/isomerase family protein n=1 Tax=Aestuariicoccus sp. MJ-SS9 TaxID=3079855 RepID=UPI002907175E|nr:enoyl-CoA hydratase/isomerase family protein [Aestuariicoccus sp. MJ-SS9]MDU8912732.1 enoyl-CoA hydratase/isomerase family protein [Aestuariicoccus sp. MJ-SS9]